MKMIKNAWNIQIEKSGKWRLGQRVWTMQRNKLLSASKRQRGHDRPF